MLVFEDLHWGDDGLLDFIDHLLDWSRAHPILVLTLARPELLDRRPGWGTDRPNATAVRLEPLGDPAMRELLDGPGAGSSRAGGGGDPGAGRRHPALRGRDRPDAPRRRGARRGGRRLPADRATSRPAAAGVAASPSSGARLDGLEPADRALVQDASVLAGRSRSRRSPR